MSPLLFVTFLNDFLSEEPCHYKFADDSAILIQGCNENDISQKLEQSCRVIEQWCRKWRMGVNGSKTELIVFNVERNIITAPSLNNEACAITKATKPLGLLIDDNLCYKDHAEKICNKAKRSWDNGSRILRCKWSLSIPTLIFLYTTIIVPQLLFASVIWFERNGSSVIRVQNHINKSIFRHSFTRIISICETLLGLPPLDIYNDAIEIKFAIKVKRANDLVSNTHSLFISNRSKAAALESKLSKFKKFLDDDTRTEYNKHEIDEFIEQSWIKRLKNTQNISLLQHPRNTQPQLNTCCPLTIGDPYVVNKICELVFGNSFAFAEYAWNMWKCASPMCICGKSEDNLYHYFFCCPRYNDIRSDFRSRSLDLFPPTRSASLRSCI